MLVLRCGEAVAAPPIPLLVDRWRGRRKSRPPFTDKVTSRVAVALTATDG